MIRQNNDMFRINAGLMFAVLFLVIGASAQEQEELVPSEELVSTTEPVAAEKTVSSEENAPSNEQVSSEELVPPEEVVLSPDSLFIDFNKAIDIIIANNIDIQEAKYNWMVQSEASTGAYGEFEPHLTARAFKEKGESPSALFTESKEEYKIGIQGRAPTGTEYNIGFNQAGYTHSEYTSELYFGGELRQHILKDGPLFQSILSNQRLARYQKEQAFQKYRETLSEVLENFCDTYWNYYFAQQTLRFAEKSSSVANEIVEDARKRFELGMLSQLDYQKAIAEYSDREGARLDAMDKLRSARLSLLLILSSQELIRDSRPISIAPNTELDSTAILDSLTFLDSISILHPTYLAQNSEVEIRTTNLDKSKNKFLPSIDVIGNYGIRGRDKNAETALRKFKNKSRRQSVLGYGIEIDIPLFANLEERHQIAAEKASVRSARSRLALIQSKLYEEYRILQKRAKELRNQWRLSETAVAYHEKELQEEFKKMELGKSNYHQIFDMEDDLRQAQQRHLECMKQLRVIDVRLVRSTGKLLMQNGLESWKDGKIALRKDLLSD